MATKKQKDKILALARERIKTAETAEAENRETALNSLKFADGDQWPEKIKQERAADGRPCLTNNKLRKFINQIAGDIRQNKPSMKVMPANDAADVAGAEVRQDLIRHIEQISTASDAYDNAIQHALDGGYGYWRILTEENEEGFDQDIKIKKIGNRFSVYLDQTAQEYTYEDGRYGFITEKMPRKEFKEKHPKHAPVEFDANTHSQYENWFEEDAVRVAEYFYKENTTKEIAQLEDGQIIELKDGLSIEDLAQQEIIVVKSRKVKTHKVMWCKLSGNAILEGPIEIPTKYIPIVPVFGHEVNIEGQRKFRSLIHDAMDPMRMYNYWTTSATETIALAPKAPLMVTPEQIEGHEQMYKEANRKNHPYLVYNSVPGQGSPQRQRQVEIPTAVVNEAARANSDISDTIGRYEASRGEGGNERSGRAILARKEGSDDTTFVFIDNYHKSITYSCKIVLDMIPRVMDTEKVIRLRGQDGKESILPINRVVMDFDALAPVIINDLSVGKYDIIPASGASFQTKRQMIASSMLDFIQFWPESGPVIGPRVADVMDWPQADEIAGELKALVGGGQPAEGEVPPESLPPEAG